MKRGFVSITYNTTLTTDETALHGACPTPISSRMAEKRDLERKVLHS